MGEIEIRKAKEPDVPSIIDIYLSDEIATSRDSSTGATESHYETFHRIDSDPDNELFVVESDGRVIGTFQMTYIPHLTAHGETRAHMEAILVASEFRGRGIGTKMMEWAEDHARNRGCKLMQFTSNKLRDRAHTFYTRLGFQPTHQGFKKVL